MKKEDLLEILFSLESALMENSIEALWSDNEQLVTCWETMDCSKKSCPSYGKRQIRCWQMVGTFCHHEKKQGKFVDKWKDCRNCPVFIKSVPTEEARIRELMNNIIFSIKCLSPQTASIFQVKRNIEHICSRYQFTKRESEILLLLLDSHSRKRISKFLNIAPETVKMHIKNIYKKCEVNSVEQLRDTLATVSE